jgi:hypothetical protein
MITIDADALNVEANDVFYRWEKDRGRTDLSDEDRKLWCIGYAHGKIAHLIYSTDEGK